jgi:hypothetical protein
MDQFTGKLFFIWVWKNSWVSVFSLKSIDFCWWNLPKSIPKTQGLQATLPCASPERFSWPSLARGRGHGGVWGLGMAAKLALLGDQREEGLRIHMENIFILVKQSTIPSFSIFTIRHQTIWVVDYCFTNIISIYLPHMFVRNCKNPPRLEICCFITWHESKRQKR